MHPFMIELEKMFKTAWEDCDSADNNYQMGRLYGLLEARRAFRKYAELPNPGCIPPGTSFSLPSSAGFDPVSKRCCP